MLWSYRNLRGFSVIKESDGWCIQSPSGVIIASHYQDKSFAQDHLHAFLDATIELTAYDFNDPTLQVICNDVFLYKSSFWFK